MFDSPEPSPECELKHSVQCGIQCFVRISGGDVHRALKTDQLRFVSSVYKVNVALLI